MASKKEPKQLGVQVAQYEPDKTDCCNFHCGDKDQECGKPAVTVLIVTDAKGVGVLLKVCRRHLCRLAVLLIEELE